MKQIRKLPVALALATSLTIAGCGDGNTSPSGDVSPPVSSADFPVTVDAVNGEVVLEKQPERIVSLSPSATEILFAIGAGDQVVAADDYSTYPAQAPTTKLSAYDPNVEAIAGYAPDLVVIANDTNGIVGALAKLDIPTIVSPAPATIDEGYDGVAALGLATGHVDETATVVADMRAAVDDALDAAPQEGLRVYHELDETFYAASSNSFIGSVYDALGATNIADPADKPKSGYPQVTEEAIIAADPELIVITDQVSYTADDVASRPGWEDVSAVKNGNIVTVDADISSRWGPRLPQLVESIADALASVKTPVG
ncbi:ABC transporter substrate-binding protein [Nocardioides sp. Soil777]|uniref:ABC transporter substrate-binding protein n=1 Tax=Nocardioides sp. Soil777 TaxID=1736409 RepID=UPI000702F920|nr:helical backbone metal receptor [Nocardioides sp. Soil777]KRF04072.1 ABC transporter substrate-binding protein [Nocardioides sp. Soil777]